MLTSRGRGWGRPTPLLIALAAVIAVVMPASASALVYEVDSIGDQVDEPAAGCKTSANNCTLRAAIEVSNSTATVDDEITFKPSLFNGESLGTITWGSASPGVTDTVTINGDGSGRCASSFAIGIEGPCVGINAGGGDGIDIKGADDVTVEGLAITNASYGIAALNIGSGSERLTVKNSWLGVGLSGAVGSINTGILLGPEADGAVIGGASSPAERNVFANASFEALDIQGASNAKVRGNWLGVMPDGQGLEAAENKEDIEITSAFGAEAVDNQIGADVGAAAGNSLCDGGCNVIGNAEVNAIDLRGDGIPAEGPPEDTTIHGNFIGIGPGGLPSSQINGIDSGHSIDTAIGGAQQGDANFIAASQHGIYAENSPSLAVERNFVGLSPTGTALSQAPNVGIFVYTDETLPPGSNALIANNRIASGESGIGVEIEGVGAGVLDNTIGLGTGGEPLGAGGLGVYAKGDTGGSTIEGNRIFGASQVGVLAKSPLNTINGNTIEASAEAGVRVEAPGFVSVFGTEIGGDAAEEENVISGTNGPAIELIEQSEGEVSETVIRRNRGVTNADVFIDLGGNGQGTGPGQPNEGIQAPSIDAVTPTSAAGTAEPFARVRLFRKAGPSVGEIQSFLGASTAGGAGNWTIGFPQQAGQTNIAATQTGVSGTSELEFAVTPRDPPQEELEACPTGSNGCGPGNPNQPRALDTKIAKKPKLKGKPTAKFKFTSTIPGSSFECKLDKGKFKKCRSPKTYKKLKPGKHVFKVRAVSPAGVKDPTPATKKFRVKP